MSQVKFCAEHEGRPVEVMGGWDRPLGHYHVAIFDEDQEPVWTSMYAYPTGGSATPEPLLKKLEELGLEIPDGFVDRFKLQEANVMHTYRNGEWSRMEW